jgi:ketosteroid isomerase-like protein
VADPATVVRRYFEIVADLGSSQEALLELLHPDVRITEHPNAIAPSGAVRDRDGAVAGFLAGKKLLATQDFEILELLASGDRVAVRRSGAGRLRTEAGDSVRAPSWSPM